MKRAIKLDKSRRRDESSSSASPGAALFQPHADAAGRRNLGHKCFMSICGHRNCCARLSPNSALCVERIVGRAKAANRDQPPPPIGRKSIGAHSVYVVVVARRRCFAAAAARELSISFQQTVRKSGRKLASERAKENRTRIVGGGGQKQGQLAGFGERSAAAAATIAGAAESRIKLSAPSELAAAFVGAFA